MDKSGWKGFQGIVWLTIMKVGHSCAKAGAACY